MIVGAGPAGISAAVQMKRMGWDPLVIEYDNPGGLIAEAFLVENYPPFNRGIEGKTLGKVFRQYMEGFQVRQTRDKVIALASSSNERIELITQRGLYHADDLILAIGTQAKAIPWKVIPQNRARIFNHVCSMIAFLEKQANSPDQTDYPVGIVGGGDCAFDYALSLSALGYQVEVLIRSTPKAIPVLQQRAEKAGVVVRHIGKNPSLQGECDHISLKTASKNQSPGDPPFAGRYTALLSAIGREKRSIEGLESLMAGPLRDRVKLIGDVAHPDLRQVGIAVGDGLRAAMVYDQKRRHHR